MGASSSETSLQRPDSDPEKQTINTSPYCALSPDIKGHFPADGVRSFQAAMRAGQVEKAFAVAEEILDPRHLFEFFEVAFHPAPGQKPLDAVPLLRQLRRSAERAPASPWPAFFETQILARCEMIDEALFASRRLLAVKKKYAWMRAVRGHLCLLQRSAYAEAVKEFTAALGREPALWKAQAFLAEALACSGRLPQALDVLSKAVAVNRGYEQAEAYGWRGDLLLWVGEAKAGLPDLDAAVAGGVRMALCWRGGAKLALGRVPEALADLDLSLSYVPLDDETLTLRGEARRQAGDPKGSFDDLDQAARMPGCSFWALANRSLHWHRAGRFTEMWRDFRAIRPDVRDYFARRAGIDLSLDPSPDDLRQVLERALAQRPGMRRADPYLFPLWMVG